MENSKIKRNIKPFDGEKYNVWKFRVRSLLAELDVLKVIDEPVQTEMTDVWKKAEKVAKSVLVEYLSYSFLGFVKTERLVQQEEFRKYKVLSLWQK